MRKKSCDYIFYSLGEKVLLLYTGNFGQYIQRTVHILLAVRYSKCSHRHCRKRIIYVYVLETKLGLDDGDVNTLYLL